MLLDLAIVSIRDVSLNKPLCLLQTLNQGYFEILTNLYKSNKEKEYFFITPHKKWCIYFDRVCR